VDVAALRCWPIEITLGEQTYVIPPLPALDWIEAIETRDAAAIVPGLLSPEDEAEVSEALVYGDYDDAAIIDAARDAAEAAAGMPWWEAFRLVRLALDRPEAFGHLALRGFDLERQSLGAFCVALYSQCVSGMDKKDKIKFDMTLKAVPANVLRADEDALSSAFMQAIRETGGTPE
jgi:hypothetical protein